MPNRDGKGPGRKRSGMGRVSEKIGSEKSVSGENQADAAPVEENDITGGNCAGRNRLNKNGPGGGASKKPAGRKSDEFSNPEWWK